MNKFKHDIVKKELSWEKKEPVICDHFNCKEIGGYKAPKSRSNLKEYYFFCLKHVSEYNKSWDFYRGLSVDQIELSMRKDAVWDRPSWPLKGDPNMIIDQIEEFQNEDYTLFEKDTESRVFLKNKMINNQLTDLENKCILALNLEMPISIDKIKKKYKKLVKIYHPDVNANNKKAEKKFREITDAYKILLKKFLKND
tara:strand:- start:980 stop:1570 length:591 start_codon:yes stop_codon:yes gene_type:complete